MNHELFAVIHLWRRSVHCCCYCCYSFLYSKVQYLRRASWKAMFIINSRIKHVSHIKTGFWFCSNDKCLLTCKAKKKKKTTKRKEILPDHRQVANHVQFLLSPFAFNRVTSDGYRICAFSLSQVLNPSKMCHHAVTYSFSHDATTQCARCIGVDVLYIFVLLLLVIQNVLCLRLLLCLRARVES